MDFLNRAMAQLKDLFGSMSPGARITSGLLLAVIVVSLGYLFNYQVSNGDMYLLGGRPFTASEFPAIHAAFDKANLTGAVVEGSRIRVPRGQESVYVGAMAVAGAIPADFHQYLEKALADLGPFVGPKERDELIKNAKQQELANIIRSMPDIESAAVHYDERREGGLSRKVITTASVTVQPPMGQTIDASRARMIRHLVAAAFAGLKWVDVTVADLNGQVYSSGSSDELLGEEHPYLKVMVAYQKLYEANIAKSLPPIPGLRYGVHVVLDREVERTERTVEFDDKKKGTTHTTEETTSESTSSTLPGGRPGVVAQKGGANSSASLATSEKKQTTEKEFSMLEQSSTPGEVISNSRKIGLVPKLVTLALAVPSSYFEAIWAKENPPVEGEEAKTPTSDDLTEIEARETKKLQDHVGMLISNSSDLTEIDTLVKVMVDSDMTAAGLQAPGEGSQALDRLPGWHRTPAQSGN